jgi:hypothetical protein
MQFDNAQFKKGAAETKTSLAELDKAVDKAGKGQGLLNLSSHMQKVQVSASKMAVIATTALANITNKAVNAGLTMAKSLAFDPIKSGFHEYEQLLNKQTVIQNATGKSATVVKKVLNDLNTYSDKTIFSFNDMTEGITSFVNAGVPLGKASKAMQGIANASALAGASTMEAQSSFRAFGQALGAGFLGLQDFKQASITGKIGTVQFKQTLIDTAVAMGTLKKKGKEYVDGHGKLLTATKNFDGSLRDQWATSKVLNAALGKYGDTSTAFGRKAFAAAQNVRTFSAFMDTLKESISSGWAGVFSNLLGGVEESTKMWTGLSLAVGNVVGGFFSFINTALASWRALGGFKKIMEGLGNVLAPFKALFKAIGDAWKAAFPNSGKGAGSALYAISAGFAAITTPLRWVASLISKLTAPLALLFQIIKTGGVAIGGVIGHIVDFVKSIVGLVDIKPPAAGGVLDWIMKMGHAIGDAIGQASAFIAKGKSIGDAFKSIHVKLPKLPDFSKMFAGLGGGGKKAGGALEGLAEPLKKLNAGIKKVKDGFKDFGRYLQGVAQGAGTVGDKIGAILGKIWQGFSKFMNGFNFDDLMASFNIAVLATFFLKLSKLMDTLSDGIKGLSGLSNAVPTMLEHLGTASKALQTQARAKLILNIAIAFGILAVSLWILSKVPMDKLAYGLVAIGAVGLIMSKTMKAMGEAIERMDGAKAGIKMLGLAVAITALAVALLIMSVALLIMNKVKWDSIVKGILMIRVLMLSLEGLGNTAGKSAGKMIAGAVAIALIAGAMIVLAGALLLFKLVDWESMGKAGVALLAVTLAVGVLALIPYEGIAKVGLAMLSASVGMVAMAAALVMFKIVKWESIWKLTMVLAALAVAIAVMMITGGAGGAAAILAIAGAIVALAVAGMIFNKVKWGSIGKLVVVLLALTVVIIILGAALALFLYVIAPVVPVLSALGIAFALFGLGFLAFAGAMAIAMTLGAAGVAAFSALATGAAVAVAVFMQTLASEAPLLKKSFLTILQTLIDTIVEAVPMVIDGIKRLWVAVKKELSGDDKKKGMGDAGKSWMETLKEKIGEAIPIIAQKAKELVLKMLKSLADNGVKIGGIAAVLLGRFIQGIADHLGGVIQAGVNVIIEWIKGIAKGMGRIADAAAKAVIKFINALAAAIKNNSAAMGTAMSNLGIAMIQGLISGIGAMFGNAMTAIGSLAHGIIDKAKSILKIFSPSRVFHDIGAFLVKGMTNGIQNNAAAAITATASMVSGQIAIANEYISGYIQKLDQQATAARGKAEGLALAAQKAAAAAKLTKGKKDDKAAENIGKQADAASKQADAAEATAQRARDAQDRADQFAAATTIEQAKMKSEDAQGQLDAAKSYEQKAAKERAAADALVKQSKAKGVSAKERKRLLAEAAALRTQAAADARQFDVLINAARGSAGEALVLQQKAGKEAADAFEEAYKADAKKAEDAAAFEKLTDAEKAVERRKQAEAAQAQADADLALAKTTAYTDLEEANRLAQKAIDEAASARQFLADAEGFEQAVKDAAASAETDTPAVGTTPGGGVLGTVVNLDPTDAASKAMYDNSLLYDSAVAAAAAAPTVEFNQYNTSPESLSPAEVYRQTNNLFTFAAGKLIPSAA